MAKVTYSIQAKKTLRQLAIGMGACLLVQAMVWQHWRETPPPMDIVSLPPGEDAVSALSLGDKQTFFRLLGMQVQTMGDLFGRFTALYRYDYSRLSGWFDLMDRLDARSDYIPTIASYYYSQSQYKPDARYIIAYLDAHASRDITRKWWWMIQAIYLANHKLHDTELALRLAKKLEGHRELPLWVQQMPAFIYEQRGEMGDALRIMEDVQAHAKNIPDGELRFMEYFVKERLKKLESDRSGASQPVN